MPVQNVNKTRLWTLGTGEVSCYDPHAETHGVPRPEHPGILRYAIADAGVSEGRGLPKTAAPHGTVQCVSQQRHPLYIVMMVILLLCTKFCPMISTLPLRAIIQAEL